MYVRLITLVIQPTEKGILEIHVQKSALIDPAIYLATVTLKKKIVEDIKDERGDDITRA